MSVVSSHGEAESLVSLKAIMAAGIKHRLIRSADSLHRGQQDVERFLNARERLKSVINPNSKFLSDIIKDAVERAGFDLGKETDRVDVRRALGLCADLDFTVFDRPSELTAAITRFLGIDERLMKACLRRSAVDRFAPKAFSIAARRRNPNSHEALSAIEELEAEIAEIKELEGAAVEQALHECDELIARLK